MKCNCDKNNNALIAPVVKHVYGNVLRLAIPLTKRVLEKIGDEIDVTDEDFIPSSEYPVQIVFSKESGTRYPVEATMRDGNIACMEDKGKLPIGTYAITVTCCDDNGNPYRFNQKSVVQVFDETREAGIVSPIEYEVQTWYLDAAIFLSLKGEDGVGIEDIETQTSTEIGGVNTVTFILTDGRTKSFTILNGSGSVDNEFDPLSQHPLSNQRITERFSEVDQSISDLFGDVDYDSSNKVIRFWDKGKTKTLALLDARPFIKDGMVNSVYISNNTLVITFNTDAGREAIGVPLTSVFNPNNYYNKTQTDSRIAAAVANINLSNYYNKSDSDNRFLRKNQFGRLGYQNAPMVVLDHIELPPVPGQDDEEYPEGEPGVIVGTSSGNIVYYTMGDTEVVANNLGSSDRVIFFNKSDGNFYYYTNKWVEIEIGGSGGIENETDPTVPTWVKAITQAQITSWNSKQSAIADLDDIRHGAALGETALQEHQDISGKANIADLAGVAFSGSYNDLNNKPSIPAEQVNADWNATSGKARILNKPTIPTNTSELTNDSGFITAEQVPEGADLSTVFADALYDSQTHRINFYGKGDTNHQTVLAYIDASPFIVDGMVDDVTLVNGTLTITFNTASGKQPITLSLGDIFNASNYYTKTDTDTLLGGKVDKETGKSLMTDAERTKLAGLSNYDDTALAGRVSTLENEGFITTETDPTVPSWAKQPTKPTYTPQEVGALPADTPIPSKTSDLTNDSGFVSSSVLANVATSGSYNDLTNKPTIPAAQVPSDWNASSGVAQVLNKPSIPTKVSELDNDEGYITSAEVAGIVTGGDMAIVETSDYIDIFIYMAEVEITPDALSLYAAQKSATIKVSGSHLKGDIQITVPSGFTVSPSTIAHTGGVVAETDVTITYTGADASTASGNITATSVDAVKSIPVAYTQYSGPTILADDSVATFKAGENGSQQKTLVVQGINLEAGITAAISGTDSGKFSVSPASIAQSGGTANGTLTITYTPGTGASGTHTASLILSSDGAESKTITLNGVVSTIAVSKQSITMSTEQGTTKTDTFTVEGANLNEDISIVASGTGFSVSPNTIAHSNGSVASTTVTVTFSPTAAGAHSGSITIQSSGASVTVALSGTAAAAAAMDANGKIKKNGLCYIAKSDGNGGFLDDVTLYNAHYTTSKDSASGKYSGELIIPSTFTALKNGVPTTFTVKAIATAAFQGNDAITLIKIPDTCTSAPANMCFNCKGLKFLHTGGITATTYGFARGCTALETLVLGNGMVRTNGTNSFAEDSAVTKVVFGENLVCFAHILMWNYLRSATSIVCLGQTPPLANESNSTSNNINSVAGIDLFVPVGKTNDYKNANDPSYGKIWENAKSITEGVPDWYTELQDEGLL